MDDEVIGDLTKEDLAKAGFVTGNAVKFLKAFAAASSAASVAGSGGAVAVHVAPSLAAGGAKAGVPALGGGGAAAATSSSPPLSSPSPALDASILSPFISRVMSADDEDLDLRSPIEARAPRLGQLSRV
jgi:hypothetical protein